MDEQSFKPLSDQELEQAVGEELPDRAAMSLINANVAIPVNAAVAANVLSTGAHAGAHGTQDASISQTN